MYTPRDFEVTDRRWIRALIDHYPFGLLIAGKTPYPSVSHIPILARERGGELRLYGHVARGNPHARSIREQAPATLVFRGPDAYVSASWYEEPYVTVPTWNYTAVQVCGRLKPYDAWSAVTMLSGSMEGAKPDAWNPQRLDPEVRERSVHAIVAFELCAERVYAKAKLSQNRTETDRERVIERLVSSSDQTERECAAAMLALRP
jgi:transcriptional regulator